jgi:predicted amidohydrolase
MRSALGDAWLNLAKVSAFVEQAVRNQVEVLCFPEMNLTGYSVDEEIIQAAQPLNGELLSGVVELARKSGVSILAGLAELERGLVYSTQVVASPRGLAGFYRKTHLGPPEMKVFSPGTDINVFALGGAAFGIQLCYDAHFPELSLVMALRGADILFFPHASPNGTPEQKLESWLRHLPARAFDNGVFVAACNQCGDNGRGLKFPGTAVIISPEGRVLEQFSEDGEIMLTAVLKRESLESVRRHRMRYFLPQRRPELYGELIKSWESRSHVE